MVTVITAEGNKVQIDRVGIEDFDAKHDFIDGIYFEKRDFMPEEKKKEKKVAVVEEVAISPEETVKAIEPESTEPTNDELKAFLKEHNVKGLHLFGRAKLMAKAEEYGFIFNK